MKQVAIIKPTAIVKLGRILHTRFNLLTSRSSLQVELDPVTSTQKKLVPKDAKLAEMLNPEYLRSITEEVVTTV
ncbi:hypothetical protein AMJ47_02770 [Parcubacteria bacterium DG_72]|nr:MAG: hypothetical protein AMJ47_02770 [Parcubacteria bacterium DG_72]